MAASKKVLKARARPTSRTSVSLSTDVYRTLGEIAQRQKVSVAWVIRDAVEKYVADRWPLLEPKASR